MVRPGTRPGIFIICQESPAVVIAMADTYLAAVSTVHTHPNLINIVFEFNFVTNPKDV